MQQPGPVKLLEVERHVRGADAERDGRFIRYAVNVGDGMRELLTYLTEQCCRGRPELCGEIFRRASKTCRPARKVPAR